MASTYTRGEYESALRRENEIIDYYAGLPSGPGGSWHENLKLAQVRASALRIASRLDEEAINDVMVAVYSANVETEPCPVCKGSGRTYSGHDPDYCDHCGGGGEIAIEPNVALAILNHLRGE